MLGWFKQLITKGNARINFFLVENLKWIYAKLSFQRWFWHALLPATKAMPKELLPIVDKPLIQYAAEEAIAAGIDNLICDGPK